MNQDEVDFGINLEEDQERKMSKSKAKKVLKEKARNGASLYRTRGYY